VRAACPPSALPRGRSGLGFRLSEDRRDNGYLPFGPTTLCPARLPARRRSVKGGPVRSHAGIIWTGETYNSVVKLTFARGASLEDPSGLFNSSLEGDTRRAIDVHDGDKIDEKARKALARAAVALNTKPAK